MIGNLIDERSPVKFLQVRGGPGTGKSTLLKAAANFINERNYFDSLVYIDLEGISNNEEFLVRFFDVLAINLDNSEKYLTDLKKYQSTRSIPGDVIFTWINKLLLSIGKKNLLIFDNMDRLW